MEAASGIGSATEGEVVNSARIDRGEAGLSGRRGAVCSELICRIGANQCANVGEIGEHPGVLRITGLIVSQVSTEHDSIRHRLLLYVAAYL